MSHSTSSSQIIVPSQVLGTSATTSLAATAGKTQALTISLSATPSQTTIFSHTLSTTVSPSRSRFLLTQTSTVAVIVVTQTKPSSGGTSLSQTSTAYISSVVSVGPMPPSTHSPSPSVNCASWNVPVVMELMGGVTPTAVLTPTVGVMARQWLACYLGVRTADVTIFQLSNATLTFSVDPGSPVNIESGTGSCVQSRALAASPEAGSVIHSYHEAPRRAQRRLSADVVPTNVSLVAVLSACSLSAGGSLVLSSTLSELVAVLPSAVATMSSGNGSSTAASRQLISFLSAAASASGVTVAEVTATAVAGSPGPASQVLPPPPAPSDSNATSAFPIIPVAVACGVALAVAVIAVVIFVFVRRRGTTKSTHNSAAVVGTNPMYSDGHRTQPRRPSRGSGLDSASDSRHPSRNHGVERGAEKPIMQANPMKRDTRSGVASEAIAPCTSALSPRSLGMGDRELGSGGADERGFTLTSNPMMGGGALAAAVEARASGVLLQQSAVTYADRHAIVGGGGAVRGRKASWPDSSDRAGTPLEGRPGASASSASAVSR